ncbi:MAG TPA: YdcF family protein [Rhodopila sp.]|jgi:uncharacterized SAM-binding protein YcdF (DUF218 family)|nr:YdcF family protein [Rhodopila sp.]
MRNEILLLAMPPMGFVVLLAIALCLRDLRRFSRWQTWGKCLAWLSVALLLLTGMPAISTSMLRALESGLPTTPPAGDPPKAIVVLGGDLIRTAQAPLGVRPGLLTLDRLRTAAALHRRTGLPILVTGGTVQPHKPSVAEVMAVSLKDDFQTPPQWTETQSINTQQNAQFSAKILEAQGIRSVYVVTHSWHMRRALLAFQPTGLTVTAAPTDLDEPLGPDWNDFVPRAAAWETCWYALHEWIGYEWYAIRPHL